MSDRPHRGGSRTPAPPRRTAPAGTPILLLAVVALLSAVGITRVHTRTRVLETGAEISRLTAEQAKLMDHKRRLQAERAFLRHPDRVRAVASRELGMVPARAETTQKIELRQRRDTP